MDSPLRSITKIARETKKFVTRKLKDTEFSADDYEFIHFIRHHAGCNQAAIAAELNLDKGSVSRKANRLEEKGYIEKRQSSTDKRNWCVYPTKKAEEVKRLSVDAENQFYQFLINQSEITEEELKPFLDVLDRLYHTSKAERVQDFRDLLPHA
jgi:DNA-binding MarR family transcriptional regulator